MYLGRDMGCKKIFLLFVLSWCWWHSTPICPQLKLRGRILQVNCMNVFFPNALILKLLCFLFRFENKNVLIFFLVLIFSLQIYLVFNRWHSFFFIKFICISFVPGGPAKSFVQSQISGLGSPECHRTAGQDSNLWPAFQDYSQANLFSQLFLLHARIMTFGRKDSESTTSSPHHSTVSSISKSEKEYFNMWQGRGWLVLNAIIWIIYFNNLNSA